MVFLPLLYAGYLVFVISLFAPLPISYGEIDVATIANHVIAMETSFNDLSTKYDMKIADLETKVDTLQNELHSTNDQLTYAKTELLSKQVKLTDLTKTLARMTTPVSYEVILTSGYFNIRDHEVLKFDKVIMNEGSGYGIGSGIFTAPIGGTYMFWAHINNADNIKNLDIHMKKNGDYIVRGDTPANHFGGIASPTALVHLVKGDQFWLTKDSGSDQIYGHGLSSYGGLLITAD